MPEAILHSESSQSILKALLYYDIFNYPLTATEILSNLSTNHITQTEISKTLDQLRDEKYIFQFEDLYCLHNKKELIERRIKGNQEALKWIPVAKQKAQLIYSFPFVRAVMASGSLSKNYMDEKSDLDFFIITEPNRLWIARMLLVLYKRIFLSGSHKYFCVNYFIDYNHLEIEEKNIFTATELATLIPLFESKYYPLLFKNNNWLTHFLPNHKIYSESNNIPADSYLKKMIESVINLLGGEWLDVFCMNTTNRRWKRIYEKQYPSQDFQIAFKTKRYASKNHPNHYQKKVVDLYQEKLSQFADKFNIHWLLE